MRVIVTGADGLIGYEAQKQLCAVPDVSLVALSRDQRLLPSAIACDLASSDAKKVLCELAPDCIVHCAAHVPATFSADAAEASRALNARIDGAIFAYVRARPTTRLVYCSSTSVYAASTEMPWTEQALPAPSNAYSAGKLESERLALLLPSSVVFRINSPYGVRQQHRTVIKVFVDNAKGGRPLRFHGSGTREQDFVHADDVARALVAGAVHSTATGVFNLAGGTPVTMAALARLVAEIASETGHPNVVVERSGEVDGQEGQLNRFSIAKAAEELGWKPQVALREGIRGLFVGAPR